MRVLLPTEVASLATTPGRGVRGPAGRPLGSARPSRRSSPDAVLRRPIAGLAAVGAAALIAGCGGGSDTSSADDFRAQADEICADANERIGTLTAPGPAAEVLPYLRAGLPIQAEELERIRALDPPEDLRADFEEATDLLQQRQDAIGQAADRIEAGEDPEAVIRDVGPEIARLREGARQGAGDRPVGLRRRRRWRHDGRDDARRAGDDRARDGGRPRPARSPSTSRTSARR